MPKMVAERRSLVVYPDLDEELPGMLDSRSFSDSHEAVMWAEANHESYLVTEYVPPHGERGFWVAQLVPGKYRHVLSARINAGAERCPECGTAPVIEKMSGVACRACPWWSCR